MHSSWRGEILRREEAAGFDLSEAFFQRQELHDFRIRPVNPPSAVEVSA